jgi:YCII-related domain
VFSVDASSGTPLCTDGPFTETKEHLGGFAVVDVADEEAARLWAGKIAVACGWPQEVRRLRVPCNVPRLTILAPDIEALEAGRYRVQATLTDLGLRSDQATLILSE